MSRAQRNLEQFLESEVKLEERNSSPLETDHDELLWNIQFTEKMFPNSILMLCNARHRNFKYISESCRDILGYTTSQFHQTMRDNFFGIVHPDDVESVSACLQHIMATATNENDLTRIRFAIHYRARHANGTYLNILDEKIMLESRNGKYVGFTLLKDISSTHFSSVKLEVFRQTGHRFVKLNEYIPHRRAAAVTSRELDVISLIQEGFNSKEIAARLSLSVHTVKNHRRRLFKKMNVRNSIELVRQVRNLSK